eukprot:scaffold47323_cov48-Phaeocystis_antarctica.AAC.2
MARVSVRVRSLLPTRAMLAASVAPCVLVTMMLGAKCLRKRRVEGATRDLGPSALRLRSVLLPL